MSDLRCPGCHEQIYACDCPDVRCKICNRELDIAAVLADREICSRCLFDELD
jgi:hypothetical protein